jgi:hypothetical protein
MIDVILFGLLVWGLVCIGITGAHEELEGLGYAIFFGVPLLGYLTSLAPIFFGVVFWVPLALLLLCNLCKWVYSSLRERVKTLSKPREPKKPHPMRELLTNTVLSSLMSMGGVLHLLKYFNVELGDTMFWSLWALVSVCCYFICSLYTYTKETKQKTTINTQK